jgi:predicted nucleic acid-binding protein
MAAELVVDASTIVKAALAGRLPAFGRRRLIAPTLLWSEVASALSQLRWRHELTDSELKASMDDILAGEIETVDSRSLIERALEIARTLGWAKTYDAEYIALAERLAIPLVTLDARLVRAAQPLVAIVAARNLLS